MITEKDGKLFPTIPGENFEISDQSESVLKIKDQNKQQVNIKEVKSKRNIVININIEVKNSDFPEIIDNLKKLIEEMNLEG